MMIKINMDQEIESKFDIPNKVSDKTVMDELERLSKLHGFILQEWKLEHRKFLYYDTPNFDLYKKGETIRRVSGFEDISKGLFRYDLKKGPIEDRYESNYWSNNELSAEQILDILRAYEYSKIILVASANTKHYKAMLHKNGTILEASLDLFDIEEFEKPLENSQTPHKIALNIAQKGGYSKPSIEEGSSFRELEIEFKEGNCELLRNLSYDVKFEIGLKSSNKQKYARVIESMQKYKKVLNPDF